MTFLSRWFAFALTALLAACAHPISMAPDLAKVETPSTARDQTVGLHISAADRALQVTTPGGGGDSVSYYPYRDLEGGIYKVLTGQFVKVVALTDPKDTAALAREGVTLVVLPKILTQSSSTSPFTWPPTFFQVQLFYSFRDVLGLPVTEVQVAGTGKAEFSEFVGDFSLAAKRASLDALQKSQSAIAADPKLR
jgi:hypothetical protein